MRASRQAGRQWTGTAGQPGVAAMLWTIFIVLMLLWLLGLATSHTLGGFIHILLILAIVSVLIRVIQGRKPLT